MMLNYDKTKIEYKILLSKMLQILFNKKIFGKYNEDQKTFTVVIILKKNFNKKTSFNIYFLIKFNVLNLNLKIKTCWN